MQRAAVEAVDLEIEHGSDFERILGRDGIDLDDLTTVAMAFSSMTLAFQQAKDPAMFEHEQAIVYSATLAAFARGFVAALQLRRVGDS